MAETTIGCDESVKEECERIKGEYENWNAFLLKLLERYKNTYEEDER